MLLQALETRESAYYVLHRVRGATARYAKQGSVKTPNKQGRHIVFLLSHPSGFQTTVPVDRVYALYGLLRVADIVDFKPDYAGNIAEACQDTMAYAFRLKGGLDILELPHDQQDEFANWVVHLSKQLPLSFPVPSKCLWERVDRANSMQTSSLSINTGLTRPWFLALSLMRSLPSMQYLLVWPQLSAAQLRDQMFHRSAQRAYA